MNYNRRSTRPDAAYYRETRKVKRLGKRGGAAAAGKGISPLAMLAIVVAMAALVWAIFLRH
jgi:hypothetical protein